MLNTIGKGEKCVVLLHVYFGLYDLFVPYVAFTEGDIHAFAVAQHYNARIVILYYFYPAVVGNAHYCEC